MTRRSRSIAFVLLAVFLIAAGHADEPVAKMRAVLMLPATSDRGPSP